MAKRPTLDTAYAISFALQLGFLVIASFIGFIVLGLWLDTHLKTQPLFLIIGSILAFIVTVYEVYRALEPLLKAPPDHA